jgi:hypothetical protein
MKMKRKQRSMWWLMGVMGILLFSLNTQAQVEVEVEERERTETIDRDRDQDMDRDRADVEVNVDRDEGRMDRSERERRTRTTMRSEDSWYTIARSGLKGGVNFSNLQNHAGDRASGRIGWHAGFFGQLFASEAFAIQPEILYSTRGNRFRYNNGNINQETNFNFHYIDVPVLAVFKLGRAVEIQAGPYWSYLLGVNIGENNDFNTRGRNNFNTWDYGLAGGIGVYVGVVQIGARYNYGLRDISRSEDAIRIVGGDARNTFGQIFLAFNLAPKGERNRTTINNYND